MAKVHSFDVFDTALIRKVAAPTDVFRLMGEVIARKLDMTSHSDFVEDFLSARINAEQRARLNCEETTLDRIWVHLHGMMPQLAPTFGPRDELQAEQKLLAPNSIIAEQIAELRQAGDRIIFISDTYLPQDFVRAQLLRHHLAEEGDGVYASSAFGLTKWTGGLFKAVLSRERIAASQLRHVGDNSHSDVAIPKRLGIKAKLVTSAGLNVWERAVLSKDARHRTAASLLAGSMRAFRLSATHQPSKGLDQLVATLLGPALMVWAAWVLGVAQRDGVQRLYFASRDGYLLCKAARIFSTHFGDIDCRHLKISRQSILLPSTDEVRQAKMSWLRRPTQPTLLSFLVGKLGLDWANVAPHFSSFDRGRGKFNPVATENDWNEFWRIVETSPVVDLVRKEIRTRRANALAFLRTEGLCDDVTSGIVDLGWQAMVQSGLRKLLNLRETDPTLRGYYLGLYVERMPASDAGKVTALFHQHAPDHLAISPQYEVFTRVDVLEQVFGLAPHGTVREYKTRGHVAEPLCASESPLHVEFVGKLEGAIEEFCNSNEGIVSYYSDPAAAREIMDALINAWCTHPNCVALQALDHIIVVDGTRAIPAQHLLQTWRLLDAAKTLIPLRWLQKLKIETRNPDPIWPEGAFYRSSVLARFALQVSATLRRLAKRTSDRKLVPGRG
jgi:FMN phosphatase YigB (HAD superfamily)